VHRKTLPAQGRPGSLGRNRRRPNVLGGSLFGIEICVTSSTNNDQLPPWANYGAHTVDLAAPGVSIYSTLRQDEYGYLSGGSMATPQVAGAAALILSVEPSLSPRNLRPTFSATSTSCLGCQGGSSPGAALTSVGLSRGARARLRRLRPHLRRSLSLRQAFWRRSANR
jgi:hypothetical protein